MLLMYNRDVSSAIRPVFEQGGGWKIHHEVDSDLSKNVFRKRRNQNERGALRLCSYLELLADSTALNVFQHKR